MTNKEKELFYKVLDRFQYQWIKGKETPVLIDGDITSLFTFICSEKEKEITESVIEKLEKIEEENDPNEGDPGSAADQEGDYS